MTLISLSFSSLPAIVLAPVLWAIIAATVIVAIARRMDAAPRLRLTRVAVVALVCATLLIAVCARYPDLDECEHLHTAWLMAQGQLPFRDFFQHHTPTFWLVLAPIMRLLPPSGNVLLWARLLALALGALAWYLGYRLARRLHAAIHPALAPMMVVLACGATMSGEFFILRPDLVSNVLSLLGLGVVWKRADALRAALSGLLLGLSLSFNPKHWPMVAVVPVLALTSGAGLASGLGISLAHAVGVALGLTPMVAWLATQGLLGPFVEWVGRFNSELGPVPGGPLPLVSVAMSVAWAVRVRANHWRALDHPTRLMATSLVGSAAIGLLYGPAMLKGSYHLQLFIILAAAAGAIEAAQFLSLGMETRRPWLAAAGFSLAMAPLVIWVTALPQGNLASAMREVALLQEVARGEPVVCVPPRHPIFAPDATAVQQPWQWLYFLRFPKVAAQLTGVDDQIQKRRPVVILGGEPRQQIYSTHVPGDDARYAFIERFTTWGNMSLPRAMALQRFLEREYHFVLLERHWYWVRRDRALPPQAIVQDPTTPPAPPACAHWSSEVEEPG